MIKIFKPIIILCIIGTLLSLSLRTKAEQNIKGVIIKPKTKSFQELVNIFSLTKKEIIKKFGHAYYLTNTGPEGTETGYEFKKKGMTIVFSSDNYVNSVYCNAIIDFNGARSGMTFNKIQKFLGKTKIEEVSALEDSNEYKYYLLRYKVINNLVILFTTGINDKVGKAYAYIYKIGR